MKTRVSKAYRGKEHIGWKKTVAGREWFLGYGTSPAHEAKAIALAEVLEAKWKLAKASGRTQLTQTDFEEAKELIASRPRWSSARYANEQETDAAPNTAPASVTPSSSSAVAAEVFPVRGPKWNARRDGRDPVMLAAIQVEQVKARRFVGLKPR
jgi:hypothetical protein